MSSLSRIFLGLTITILSTTLSAKSMHCDVETPYSVDLRGEGIGFSSKQAELASLRLHGGRLYVDGREVALSAADRKTIRAMEQEVRALSSDAIVIASDAIDIAFDVLNEVSAALIEDGARQTELLRSMEKTRSIVQMQIRDAVLNRPFDESAFEELVESQIEVMGAELVKVVLGDLVPRAIAAALSGNEATVRDIEARTKQLETDIEQRIEMRAKDIERRAESLCPRVQSLVDMQSSLAVRFKDGARIELLRH